MELFTFHLSSRQTLNLVFLRKKIWRNALDLNSKKLQDIIRGNIYFDIIVFSCLSFPKSCLEFLLISFAREIKGFYQISWGNEIDFTNMMYISPKISAQE